jgi:hypothetical protein
MKGRTVILAAASTLVAIGPAYAGPCTDQIAELEKTITSKYEGAEPARTGSAQGQTSAAVPAGGAARVPSESAGSQQAQSGSQQAKLDPGQREPATQAMNALNRAKELDRQGNEAECMKVLSEVKGQPAAK